MFLVISKPNAEVKVFIKEAIILDMEKKKVIHNVFFEEGKDDDNLNTLSDYILENGLLKTAFTTCVNSKELFLEILRNKDFNIKNKGIFTEFLYKSFSINAEDVEKFFSKIEKEY